MQTLKKGSKGEDVKKLQQLLHISADGIFGSITEEAVKKFQKEHKLEVDGICGPKTWEALGVKPTTTTNSKCVDPSVVYLPLSTHISKLANRPIKYIAIHYTAGASSVPGSARRIKGIFEKRQASADFAVDDKEIVQINPDLKNYYCWSVGDKKNPYGGGGSLYGIATNRNTISIEICSNLKKGTSADKANHEGWYYTEEALNNAVKLVKILMKKYNIDINHVVRHYDISGKICPGIIGWNNGALNNPDGTKTNKNNNSIKWVAFKDRLK